MECENCGSTEDVFYTEDGVLSCFDCTFEESCKELVEDNDTDG